MATGCNSRENARLSEVALIRKAHRVGNFRTGQDRFFEEALGFTNTHAADMLKDRPTGLFLDEMSDPESAQVDFVGNIPEPDIFLAVGGDDRLPSSSSRSVS